MEKEFVPYTEALELKELGFDEPCFAYYLTSEIERTGEIILHYCSRGKEILRNNDWRWVYENFPMFRKYLKSEHLYMYSTNSSKLMNSAPTFSQAFRWFREKYNLVIEPCVLFQRLHSTEDDHFEILEFGYRIYSFDQYRGGLRDKVEWDGYDNSNEEKAELACLDKLLEIVEFKTN